MQSFTKTSAGYISIGYSELCCAHQVQEIAAFYKITVKWLHCSLDLVYIN